MESATIRRAPPLPGLIQLGLVGLLVALAGIAWALTDDRMTGMDAGPGTDPGALGFFLGVWVVMMAAMMFPSIAPMVLMHVRIQEGRRERGQPVADRSDVGVRRRLPDQLGGGGTAGIRDLPAREPPFRATPSPGITVAHT